MNNKEFLIIAHRGESYDAPENTLSSINLAWERNADAVEIDVQLTKDNKIIVIHDKTTLRTGGKYKRISSNNYKDLKNIDVGKFRGSKFKNEKIPLLDEVVETIPLGKYLFIEIKCDKKILEPLMNLVKKKKVEPATIKFIGFDIETMKLIKEKLPEFESYWIIEGKHYKSRSSLINSVEKCITAGLQGLDVQLRKFLNFEVIHYIKNSGLSIYTWTVDDPAKARQLYLDGINGITTNRAHWLKQQLSEITNSNVQITNK